LIPFSAELLRAAASEAARFCFWETEAVIIEKPRFINQNRLYPKFDSDALAC